jgi:hypothetical protein
MRQPGRNKPCARTARVGDRDLLTCLDPTHQIRGVLARRAKTESVHAPGYALVLAAWDPQPAGRRARRSYASASRDGSAVSDFPRVRMTSWYQAKESFGVRRPLPFPQSSWSTWTIP